MFVLIDNYDSFTWNLVQYFGDLGHEVAVHRNDQIAVEDVLALKPDGIIISPGPCDPGQAGICLDLIAAAGEKAVPLMGVCLGHQSIGQVYGGKVVRAPEPVHGKTWDIYHEGKSLFAGLPSPLTGTRYHSLVVERESLPACLDITAETKDGLIMGLAHKNLPVHGIQFHPESIATQYGHEMINNFIRSI